MRFSFRSSLIAALGAAAVVGGAALAQTPQPAEHANGNVEHGRYLVHDVAMCVECHSPRDDQGSVIQSQEFMGGPIPFRPPWPNDWALIAPRNKGLPGYDDALAMRLLTEGAIGRDGRQLRPPMPRFHMTKQDAADVIAYMRSLK
jgi:mono/diheme cytochrome c family protein